MAINRSHRLHKKLCVDEFQELGFGLNFHYKKGADADAVNAFILRFIDQAIETNRLTYGGYDGFGFVCLTHRSSVNGEQRALIETWSKQQPELASIKVGALVDAWYPGQPVLPKL